jgi:hypothetical protein
VICLNLPPQDSSTHPPHSRILSALATVAQVASTYFSAGVTAFSAEQQPATGIQWASAHPELAPHRSSTVSLLLRWPGTNILVVQLLPGHEESVCRRDVAGQLLSCLQHRVLEIYT